MKRYKIKKKLKDTEKRSKSAQVTGVPEGEKNKNGEEKICEEINVRYAKQKKE